MLNTANGLGSLAQDAGNSINEICWMGAAGFEANGRFNQKVLNIGKGLIESGGKAIDAAHLAASGNWSAAGETALTVLGDTPEEVVANVLVIAVSEGAGRALKGAPSGATARGNATTLETSGGTTLNAPEVQAQLSEPSKPKPIAKDVPTYLQNEAGVASRRLNSLGRMKNRIARTFHRLLSHFGRLDSSSYHFTGKARLHLTKHPNAMPTSGRCPGQPREILFSCHVGSPVRIQLGMRHAPAMSPGDCVTSCFPNKPEFEMNLPT